MNRKEYMKKYNKQYYDNNLEKLKEEHEQYYKENSEKIIEQKKQYNIGNREKIIEYQEQWRKNNSGHIKQYCQDNSKRLSEKSRQWQKDNPERVRKRVNQCYKQRYKTDLIFRLNEKMRVAINRALKGNKNGRHWETLVGYTLNDLIERLKKTMPEGCIWQDYLEGKLHIDHKIPKSIFNYSKSEHIDFKKCWALKNLQLLSAKENLVKGTKLLRPFQMGLKI